MLKYDIIKTWRSRKMCKKQWRTSIARVKKGEYLSIGVPRPDNKGFVYRLGYGYFIN